MAEDYISPNDKVNRETGEVVPKSAEDIAKRLKKMRDGEAVAVLGEVTAYKVLYEWETARGKPVPHKKGTMLSVSEIAVPEGVDRDDHIAELVEVGLLQPQYATAEMRKAVEEQTRLMTPAEAHRLRQEEAAAAAKAEAAAKAAKPEGQ